MQLLGDSGDGFEHRVREGRPGIDCSQGHQLSNYFAIRPQSHEEAIGLNPAKDAHAHRRVEVGLGNGALVLALDHELLVGEQGTMGHRYLLLQNAVQQC